MTRTYWKALLFTTGATSTAVEVVGLRLIAPIFGTSLPIWGGIIAAVLAGLAIGYRWGGQRARQATTFATVQRQAALAASSFLLLPIGMRLVLVLRDFSFAEAPALMLLALLLAWLLLLPPSILFGAISPLAVEAEAAGGSEHAGYSAGGVFMLTTLGSLFGILLPSFFLIPIVGTLETTWLFVGALLLLSAPALTSRVRIHVVMFVIVVVLIQLALTRSAEADTLFAQESAYQHIIVRELPGGTIALIHDAGFGVQSVKPPGLHTMRYWDYLAALPLYFPDDEPLDVLVLGSAASTTERQMTRFWPEREFHFTSVELDPAVIAVADRFFDPPARDVVVSDARTFVERTEQQFDVIIVDTYAREITVPFHLATREFFQTLEGRLAPGGVLAINANAASVDTLFIRSLARTLADVLPETRVLPVPDSCNKLLFASFAPLEERGSTSAALDLLPGLRDLQRAPADGLLFTDNRAPTDLLGMQALCWS